MGKEGGSLGLSLPGSASSSSVHVPCRLEVSGHAGSGPCRRHGVVLHLPRR